MWLDFDRTLVGLRNFDTIVDGFRNIGRIVTGFQLDCVDCGWILMEWWIDLEFLRIVNGF